MVLLVGVFAAAFVVVNHASLPAGGAAGAANCRGRRPGEPGGHVGAGIPAGRRDGNRLGDPIVRTHAQESGKGAAAPGDLKSVAREVFISYSQPDYACAMELVARVEGEGIDCWIAPRDIAPSADWAAEIIDAISNARVMILVFSASSNDSPQVRREVERAVHKNVSILPFRIESVVPSKSLEYFLSSQHWMDAFPPPREAHYARLCAYLRRQFGKAESSRSARTRHCEHSAGAHSAGHAAVGQRGTRAHRAAPGRIYRPHRPALGQSRRRARLGPGGAGGPAGDGTRNRNRPARIYPALAQRRGPRAASRTRRAGCRRDATKFTISRAFPGIKILLRQCTRLKAAGGVMRQHNPFRHARYRARIDVGERLGGCGGSSMNGAMPAGIPCSRTRRAVQHRLRRPP